MMKLDESSMHSADLHELIQTSVSEPAQSCRVRYTIVIPVYCNEGNIPDLLEALHQLFLELSELEIVFVVDGSPDHSAEKLAHALNDAAFEWQLVELSRNFGSFAAIRQGLALARGEFVAVLAADLQEPPDLISAFFRELTNGRCDLAVGVRAARADPVLMKLSSALYWRLYRFFVMPEIPRGGVDVFACNRAFLKALLALEERNSFLIGQLFWLGFRRIEIAYERRARTVGKSAWVFRRRLRYMLDSLFAFSDLPITVLFWLGSIGAGLSLLVGFIVILFWLFGLIDVRGYVPIMLAVSFVGSMLLLGQGIVGCYIWRIAENTKKRPLSIILSHRTSHTKRTSG
jgi:glycosyltransferase involved in cell wall biosynthesis